MSTTHKKTLLPPKTRGRKAKCLGHFPIDPFIEEYSDLCRNCFGSDRKPTKIKYCDGCRNYHSEKNFKREKEKHNTNLPRGGAHSSNLIILPVPKNDTKPEKDELGASKTRKTRSPIDKPNTKKRGTTRCESPTKIPALAPAPSCSFQVACSPVRSSHPSPRSLYQGAASGLGSKLDAKPTQSLGEMINLANTLVEQGRFQEAIPIFDKVISAHCHENSCASLVGKAKALAGLNKYEEAELVLRGVLEGLFKGPESSGLDHPLVCSVFDEIASVWNHLAAARGQPILASMAEQVLSSLYLRRCRLIGPFHRETLKALHLKALAVESQGRLFEALRIAATSCACVVADEALTLRCRRDLARMLHALGARVAESASPELRESIKRHFDSLNKDVNFARSFFRHGHRSPTKAMKGKKLQMAHKSPGEDLSSVCHDGTSVSLQVLASCENSDCKASIMKCLRGIQRLESCQRHWSKGIVSEAIGSFF